MHSLRQQRSGSLKNFIGSQRAKKIVIDANFSTTSPSSSSTDDVYNYDTMDGNSTLSESITKKRLAKTELIHKLIQDALSDNEPTSIISLSVHGNTVTSCTFDDLSSEITTPQCTPRIKEVSSPSSSTDTYVTSQYTPRIESSYSSDTDTYTSTPRQFEKKWHSYEVVHDRISPTKPKSVEWKYIGTVPTRNPIRPESNSIKKRVRKIFNKFKRKKSNTST